MNVPFGPLAGLDSRSVSISCASSEIKFYQQWDNATFDWPVVKIHKRPSAQPRILFERCEQEAGHARSDTFSP
jgi:hypothetical protein